MVSIGEGEAIKQGHLDCVIQPDYKASGTRLLDYCLYVLSTIVILNCIIPVVIGEKKRQL